MIKRAFTVSCSSFFFGCKLRRLFPEPGTDHEQDVIADCDSFRDVDIDLMFSLYLRISCSLSIFRDWISTIHICASQTDRPVLSIVLQDRGAAVVGEKFSACNGRRLYSNIRRPQDPAYTRADGLEGS